MILGVPTLACYDLLLGLLQSADEGSERPERYIIVDNGGGLEAFLRQTGQSLPVNTDLVVPDRNLGVAGAWNRIIERGGGDVIISNDDIVLYKDTMKTMLDAADKDADIVSAWDEYAYALFWYRPSAYAKVGLFDERFYPAYFEDGDFERRLSLAGGRRVSVQAAYHHEGSATVKRKAGQALDAHHARFRALKAFYEAKWGGPPHAEKFTVPFNGGPAVPVGPDPHPPGS